MDLISQLFILALSIFLGFALITRVPPLLHTPLMSEANAICGIIIVGALAAAGTDANSPLTIFLGTGAVALATFNVIGGYLVTERMLKMFKKKG
ncbi:MAG: NAD(P) transhydrogenase subunit alpha [Candidatus Omnitrophica bacterium]|nr:NAD(P) transhydrogenase subunit alpha [Candidatus Omnitrophota bacterium]MDE2009606.1 NAD(P) transhydrogenase subunit alpha [Candidatus Omnitrophota bacterium]MDE2214466.1 NAD(P) transhydrogenase subunit alpha [Candidatus Omnitrophota bacterium]MDE2231606.1 NAD(P) transhydrogenase subunit alpha [Candidatus Omnitrophota bacterium]